MKILITHVDLDGFGINILESLFHSILKFDLVLNKNYGFELDEEVLKVITPENDIVITDLSIPEIVYSTWKNQLHSLQIIDHHESSRYLSKYKDNIWSIDYCGTKLFWLYYLQPKLKDWEPVINYFVDLVDTYDRWQDTSDLWLDATRLNKVNSMLSQGFVHHIVNKIKESPDKWVWTEQEQKYYKKAEEEEDLILASCEVFIKEQIDNNGYKFTILEIDDKSRLSMVCSKFLKRHTDIDYVICYGKWVKSFSFRSNKDYINLTKLHGVKGHKLAAGADYTNSDFWKLVSGDYCCAWVKDGQRKSNNLLLESIKEN